MRERVVCTCMRMYPYACIYSICKCACIMTFVCNEHLGCEYSFTRGDGLAMSKDLL